MARLADSPRVRWGLTPAWSLWLAIAMLVAATIGGMLGLRLAGLSPDEESLRVSVVGGLSAFALEMLMFVAIIRSVGTAHPDAPTEPSPPIRWSVPRAAVLGAVALGVAWFPLQALGSIVASLQAWLGGPTPPPAGHDTLALLGEPGNVALKAALIVHVILLGPIAEELMFRGAVQQGLRNWGVSRWRSICLTATLFALVHIGVLTEGAVLSGLLTLFALAVVLGWLAERTGRLIAPIVAHACFNAVNLAIYFAGLP